MFRLCLPQCESADLPPHLENLGESLPAACLCRWASHRARCDGEFVTYVRPSISASEARGGCSRASLALDFWHGRTRWPIATCRRRKRLLQRHIRGGPQRRRRPRCPRDERPRSEHKIRKSTRLNSSHLGISYAVFCLKKKKNRNNQYSE